MEATAKRPKEICREPPKAAKQGGQSEDCIGETDPNRVPIHSGTILGKLLWPMEISGGSSGKVISLQGLVLAIYKGLL